MRRDMHSRVRITKNQRRGGSGESMIEARLKSFSNVMRPQYDVGIDYVCELIENESPSKKYFCVQAKSTKRFRDYWIRGIKKETLWLWLEQRFPVFLIVYDESSGNCYWASIQDNRKFLSDKLRSDARTVGVKVDKSNLLEGKDSDNTAFIKKIKQDSVLINALHGIPEMIGGGYVGTIPVLYLSDVARETIKDRVRLGMDYLIYDCLLKDDLQHAYELSGILAEFDHGHYDHFLILARICRRLSRFEEAEKNYNVAIDVCKKDPKWNKRKGPNDPSIEDIIKMIENEKAKFRHNPKL